MTVILNRSPITLQLHSTSCPITNTTRLRNYPGECFPLVPETDQEYSNRILLAVAMIRVSACLVQQNHRVEGYLHQQECQQNDPLDPRLEKYIWVSMFIILASWYE